MAVGTEEENEEHLIGSWADFNSHATEETNVWKFLLEYLPTMIQPSQYEVWKNI